MTSIPFVTLPSWSWRAWSWGKLVQEPGVSNILYDPIYGASKISSNHHTHWLNNGINDCCDALFPWCEGGIWWVLSPRSSLFLVCSILLLFPLFMLMFLQILMQASLPAHCSTSQQIHNKLLRSSDDIMLCRERMEEKERSLLVYVSQFIISHEVLIYRTSYHVLSSDTSLPTVTSEESGILGFPGMVLQDIV